MSCYVSVVLCRSSSLPPLSVPLALGGSTMIENPTYVDYFDYFDWIIFSEILLSLYIYVTTPKWKKYFAGPLMARATPYSIVW